ncbi:MAG TPA: hypothetical protein VNT99_00765, partial [Methylomirabilota bacterium]|nr:hypothetical protein [Methylomirabilota bacterium]
TNPPAKYPLTVSVLPANGGTVTIAPPQPAEGYEAGTEVTLTASAATGFAFSNWTGFVTSGQNPLLLTMDGAKAITANFVSNAVPAYALTLVVNPPDSGTIQAQPAPNGPNGTYLEGTIVTLTATPALDFAFTNWTGDVGGTGNSVALTIDSDKSVTANFFASITPLFVLTVVTNPPGAGTIQIAPPPNGTNGTYLLGTVVNLTATAVGTNVFTNWTGAVSSMSNRIAVLMDADKSVTANFAAVIPPTYTLTVEVSPTNGGVVLVTPGAGANGTYAAGTTVALAAQPNAGFRFTNWTGAVNSTNNPIVIVMNGDRSVRAAFVPRAPVEFPTLSGVYAGLLIDDSGTNFTVLSYAASGLIQLRISKTGAYRGTATIGGVRELVAGQFDRFGYAPFVARRATLNGSLQIDDAGLRISGLITDGRKSPQLLLYRAVTTTNIAALAGRYSLTLSAAGPVAMDGVVTLRVLPNGSVRMQGKLGDGTGFSERTFLSADATIPWFVPLYSRRGVILSWLDVRDDGTVQGTARWFRPGNSRHVHNPTGFGLVVPVIGSRLD